jgi:phospholipase/carboxylesterase
MPHLAGRRVLVSEGRYDPIVASAQGEELASLLRDAGASVTLEWREAGHTLVQEDVKSSRRWLDALEA